MRIGTGTGLQIVVSMSNRVSVFSGLSKNLRPPFCVQQEQGGTLSLVGPIVADLPIARIKTKTKTMATRLHSGRGRPQVLQPWVQKALHLLIVDLHKRCLHFKRDLLS